DHLRSQRPASSERTRGSRKEQHPRGEGFRQGEKWRQTLTSPARSRKIRQEPLTRDCRRLSPDLRELLDRRERTDPLSHRRRTKLETCVASSIPTTRFQKFPSRRSFVFTMDACGDSFHSP